MNRNEFPFFVQSHPLGHVHEDPDVTVFFGNKNSDLEALHSAFPEYEMMVLRQTHSDKICLSPFTQPAPEGDAHYTTKRHIALCIRTADCIPVFIYDPSSRLIAGIHAGWRGVENEIIRKTAAKLAAEGANLDRARAWIGPHIGADSFEVELKVGALLEARFDAVRGHSDDSTSLISHADKDKTYVDLFRIAKAQLAASGIGRERLLDLSIDTMKSSEHESFRRDRDKAGRQLSFIALK